jgi:hypothetical protein
VARIPFPPRRQLDPVTTPEGEHHATATAHG